MKYFIGYLISGEAAQWHINVAKDISRKFGTWKIHEKLPPHITIFYPFNIDNIKTIENVLEIEAEKKNIPGYFKISGFDHFGDKVVFAKVETDESAKTTAENLRKTLKEIPDMPENEFPDWHPHATLANRVSPQEINQIWDYVQTLEKPSFNLPFDNVTIFEFEGDRKWTIRKSFIFNSVT